MNTAPTEILWTAGFFNERFPAPVSPLAWSFLGPLIEDTALRDPLRYMGYPDAETVPLVRLWHGHPYSNVLALQIYYSVFPDFLLPEDAYRYFPEGDTAFRRQAPYPRSILAPRFLGAVLRAFLADPANWSPLHNYRKWAAYTREHDRRVDALRGRYTALIHAEPAEILAALDEASAVHRCFLRIHRWSLMDADLTFGLLKRLTRRWVDREHGGEIAARAVAGTPNKTMEVDASLRELAGETGIAGRRVQEFLARHGHRSFSLDIAVPTFADDAAQVLRLARAMCDPAPAPSAASEQGVGAEIKQRRLPFWKRGLFNAVRRLAIRYVALREDQRYYWQKSLAVSRHLYLMLADRLVATGVLAQRDEVFSATHAELVDFFRNAISGEALAASVAQRRGEWDTYRRQAEQSPATAYPPFLRGDEPLVPATLALKTWQARAVSPGVARGAARIVRTPAELSGVQPGEILVAPSTDPAWTPIFTRIAGLVLERGGVLSHGAVVAREYHVPAVAGIANITNEIQGGEWIQVDGNKGTVTRL